MMHGTYIKSFCNFYIVLTMHCDKLYNRTNEMHFLSFILKITSTRFEKASYSSSRGDLIHSIWYVSCIHIDHLLMMNSLSIGTMNIVKNKTQKSASR